MPEPVLSSPDQTVCFHCGEAVSRPGGWLTQVDGAWREMCCAGCQAVARTIEAAGLQAYYRHRSAPAAGPQAMPASLAAELALYDEPEWQARFVRTSPAEHATATLAEATLLIEGLRCGACLWLIERSLMAQPGVRSARVDYASERATLRWDPSRVGLSSLLARLAEIGYRALPFDERRRREQHALEGRRISRRLFIAGLGMMQVMMYAFPGYTAQAGEIDWEHAQLLRWASLLLTLPVVGYSAQPFFLGAWRDLRARSPGMDVPVALGIAAAFLASVWATVQGSGEVWFDSVTMFVFLLLAARHLEALARRRAARAVDALAAAAPEKALRLCAVPEVDGPGVDGPALLQAATETVPAMRLAPGDLIRVDQGAAFPVDALLVAGRTEIDQALLTGESTPQPRAPGDAVAGGATNTGSPVVARVLRASADSTLSMIEAMIARAGEQRPALAALADRIARHFVLGLLVLAAGVFAFWWHQDPARALPIAIAVLVVSCPCALSLATPAALAAATDGLTRHGILLANGRALEALADCTEVVFDKTGTLTLGRPVLQEVETWQGLSREQALTLAAMMEAGSAHPLAAALREAAASSPTTTQTQPILGDLQVETGAGVQARVDGQMLRLGSATWCSRWVVCPAPAHADPEIWLVSETERLARFRLRDALREDAADTIAALRAAGLRAHLLTGDHPKAAQAVAQTLGLNLLAAQATPETKMAQIRTLQQQGRRVLMIGDGVNDAPVLAGADASVAVGDATALARTAADFVLLTPHLRRCADLVLLARQTRRVIRQNLAWASLYNALAIPTAAIGLVPPWLAALGMSGSSLLVVGNALRLRIRRWKPSTS